jgi:hypothetical protein
MTKTTKRTRTKGQTRRPEQQGGHKAIAAPVDAEAAAEAQQAESEQATAPSPSPLHQDGDEATTAVEPDTAAKAEPAPEPKKDRAPSKKDRLVEFLRRENGATIEELMAEFGWQAHTVRGAISIAAKRLGVTAERVEKGRYCLPAG